MTSTFLCQFFVGDIFFSFINVSFFSRTMIILNCSRFRSNRKQFLVDHQLFRMQFKCTLVRQLGYFYTVHKKTGSIFQPCGVIQPKFHHTCWMCSPNCRFDTTRMICGAICKPHDFGNGILGMK